MNDIESLRQAFLLHKWQIGSTAECVSWAVARLQNDEEEGDQDIVLLAGSASDSEIIQLSERVLKRYLPDADIGEELCAGKYIVELRLQYLDKAIDIPELDRRLSVIYRTLHYPNWLVMLTRNCEYATDICAFLEPFENELEYIATLWSSADTTAAFNRAYDRAVSNTHDIEELLAR